MSTCTLRYGSALLALPAAGSSAPAIGRRTIASPLSIRSALCGRRAVQPRRRAPPRIAASLSLSDPSHAAGRRAASPTSMRTFVVIGKHLAPHGIDFYCRQPLAERRVIASLDCGREGWIGLVLELAGAASAGTAGTTTAAGSSPSCPRRSWSSTTAPRDACACMLLPDQTSIPAA